MNNIRLGKYRVDTNMNLLYIFNDKDKITFDIRPLWTNKEAISFTWSYSITKKDARHEYSRVVFL